MPIKTLFIVLGKILQILINKSHSISIIYQIEMNKYFNSKWINIYFVSQYSLGSYFVWKQGKSFSFCVYMRVSWFMFQIEIEYNVHSSHIDDDVWRSGNHRTNQLLNSERQCKLLRGASPTYLKRLLALLINVSVSVFIGLHQTVQAFFLSFCILFFFIFWFS